MRMPPRPLFLALLLAVPAAGCTSTRNPFRAAPEPAPSPELTPAARNTSGMVFGGRDMAEHGGNLLSFLRARVSGMSVNLQTQPCPSVTIRSRKSLFGSNDPVIYLDGNRTANSCVLEMLQTRDLSRVEVYPQGVSNRPGYEAHPNGLILVFAQDGPISREARQVRRVVSASE